MDDMTGKQVDKDQNDFTSGEIASEFRDLGNNLKHMLQSAWESQERKNLQAEIQAGLDDFTRSLDQTFTEFKESSTGEQLKSDIEELRENIRSGKTESEVRSGLVSALRSINQELEKFSKSKEAVDQDKSSEGS